MNKPYRLEVMPGAPSKWQVIGPDAALLGEFSGAGAEVNAVTLCGLLNHAYDLGMSAAMQAQAVVDRAACGLLGGGPVPKVEGAIPQ